jgi:hypothetical protein
MRSAFICLRVAPRLDLKSLWIPVDSCEILRTPNRLFCLHADLKGSLTESDKLSVREEQASVRTSVRTPATKSAAVSDSDLETLKSAVLASPEDALPPVVAAGMCPPFYSSSFLRLYRVRIKRIM